MIFISRTNLLLSVLIAVIIGVFVASESAAAVTTEDAQISEDQTTNLASWKSTRLQHSRLPADDIWWTVNGKDMLWNFKNLHQLFPTVNVYRSGVISELQSAPDSRLSDFKIDIDDVETTLADFIHSDRSTVMGVVVMHAGKVVFESYPRMQAYEAPIYWSVAKVFPGLLVRILEERGQVDVSKPIDFYLNELSASAFAGVTVRNILDMASGLDCSDEYETRDSCYYQYSISIGDGHWTEGDSRNPYEFVANLKAKRVAEQGTTYSYSGVNTFILSWLVEKITGSNFQDVFTKEVWSKIGAEANGSFIAPNQGVAITHGGFLSRLRDLARFGALYTPSFTGVADSRVITEEHLELLQKRGRSELTSESRYRLPGFKHNVYQWDAVLEDGTMYKGGWAGQGLIVNPNWDVVAVFTGYFKDDNYSEEPFLPHILKAIKEVYGKLNATP